MDLDTLRIFVFIMGPLVLVSYVLGIKRAKHAEDLWGGIEGRARMATIPFMFLAAAGFLAAAYILLFDMTQAQLAALRWPWDDPDGNGLDRLFWAYVLYLVPSALWLEATLLHINRPRRWTPALVVVVLTLVSIGLAMLGLLAWSAYQDGVPGAGWLVAGVVGMAIQSVINDNIIWVWKFPWLRAPASKT